MKGRTLIACAMAALALAGCKKSSTSGGETSTAADEKVTITQANPPPGGTWADVVNQTSDGFMMGNPNAKVKLVEIGSLSCPHCKAFEQEGVPTLVEKYVKTGKVSWEFRPYVIHGPIDLAADILIRCSGLKTFFPLSKALYADQDSWMGKVETNQDKFAQIQNMPPNQAVPTTASLLGLQDWFAARGLPQAKANQCLSNQQMIEKEAQVTANVNDQYPEFTGTPAFVINGKMVKDAASWDKLLPALDAAVK
jgi:protein-disulfide isomerase